MSDKDSEAPAQAAEGNGKAAEGHEKDNEGSENGKKAAAAAPSPPKPQKVAFRAQLYVLYSGLQLSMKYSANSPENKRQLVLLVIASLAKTGSLVAKMKLNEYTGFAQASGQYQLWVRTMWQGGLAAIAISLLSSWHTYVEKTLAQIWSGTLTRKLHEMYFAKSRFYQIVQGGRAAGAVVDADVRLTEDVVKLTGNMANLLSMFIGGLFDCTAFTFLLGSLGWREFLYSLWCQGYMSLVYIIANDVLVVDWAGLTGAVAGADSALKQAFNRADTHAESICSLQGGISEGKLFINKLSAVVKANTNFYLEIDLFDGALYYLLHSVFESTPLLWMTALWVGATGTLFSIPGRDVLPIPMSQHHPLFPIWYSKALKNFWGGNYAMFGVWRITRSLWFSLQSFASILRIQELEYKLQQAAGAAESTNLSEDDCLEFKDVSICTPSGALLLDKLNFGVRWGETLLLTGQNGAGKSSIFRCMGGLWPVKSGSIWQPSSGDSGASAVGLAGAVYYVPQRPYNALGTLFEEFCYPDVPPDSFTEKELRSWLDFADLGYLADIPGALTEELDWETILSRGEQQRLTILRVFWRRPKFAILDECTAAVSGEMERRLFEICPRIGISCITIAHRPALLQYHQQQLNLTGKPQDDNGGWTLQGIPNGVAPFDPTCASQTDAQEVIKNYLAERNVKLKSAHQEESREFSSKRKAEIKSTEAAAKVSTKIWSHPKYHPDLFIGLKQSGARWRLIAGAICLVARTHVTYMNMGSMPYVIASAITGNYSAALSAVGYNISLGLLNLLLDRIFKRCYQRLQIMMLEGLLAKVCKLFVHKSAMHYAATFGILDNAGVRAGEVHQFTDGVRGLVENNAKGSCIVIYGAILAVRNQGWAAVFAILANFPLHFLCTKFVMPNYLHLSQQVADLQAKFAKVHSRFRQNIEPVAFSSGGRAEQAIIERRFDVLQKFTKDLNSRELIFNSVNTFLIQADLLPLVFNRTLSMYWVMKNPGAIRSGVDLIGMMNFSRAVAMVFNNISALINIPVPLAGVLGTAHRVSELVYGLEEAASKAPSVANPSALPTGAEPFIFAHGIDVVTPKTEDPLAVGLDFTVARAASLSVTGPNGSGKSLLGAYIAGLRPLCGATPSISVCGLSVGAQRPHIHDLLRIPQRPYLAVAGLGDNVAYPLPGSEQPAARLQECLDMVGIGYLVERHGGLEREPELPWDEILSGGEQQRIGIARCLFHRPVFAILDDCTSMVSQEAELDLYRMIREGGTIPITMSQRLTLPELHSQELQLGCGTFKGWQLSKIEK